jgi:hypothetical protein
MPLATPQVEPRMFTLPVDVHPLVEPLHVVKSPNAESLSAEIETVSSDPDALVLATLTLYLTVAQAAEVEFTPLVTVAVVVAHAT